MLQYRFNHVDFRECIGFTELMYLLCLFIILVLFIWVLIFLIHKYFIPHLSFFEIRKPLLIQIFKDYVHIIVY